MYRIGFIGAQDTGKTTIAKELSSRFRARDVLTDYVEECARTYISRWGAPVSTMADQLFVIDKQIEREAYISPKCELMFTDSPLTLGYVYAILSFGSPITTKDRDILLHIYDKILNYGRYDFLLYLRSFRSPTPDGIRSAELISKNDQIDLMIRSFLDLHKLTYTEVPGSTIEARINWADSTLQRFLKEKQVK